MNMIIIAKINYKNIKNLCGNEVNWMLITIYTDFM